MSMGILRACFGIRAFATASICAGVAAASAATFPITLDAFSHPNGNQSANPNAVDSRDYGLRLDYAGRVNTFAFEGVTMTFFNPPEPDNNTVMAVLSGTIAHLQSSNGAAVGYAAGSGLDALDQRYSMNATFRVISFLGNWHGAETGPYEQMFDDFIAGGINANNRIAFALSDLEISPQFGGQRVFDGPLTWDEYPGSDANPDPDSFYLQYRHRLAPGAFAGPDWDVIAAAGWLQEAVDGAHADSQDFLFYLTPEPASLGMIALGAMAFVRRR